MSDTPRMNMAKSSNERYSIGCQIERELAEAKAELAKVREGFDMCQSDYKCLAERWGEALKERDLAQARADSWRKLAMDRLDGLVKVREDSDRLTWLIKTGAYSLVDHDNYMWADIDELQDVVRKTIDCKLIEEVKP